MYPFSYPSGVLCPIFLTVLMSDGSDRLDYCVHDGLCEPQNGCVCAESDKPCQRRCRCGHTTSCNGALVLVGCCISF